MDKNEIMVIYSHQATFSSAPGHYIHLFLAEDGVIDPLFFVSFLKKKGFSSCSFSTNGFGPFESKKDLEHISREYLVDHKILLAHLVSDDLYNSLVESENDFSIIFSLLKERSEKINNEELTSKKGILGLFGK